MFSRIFVVYSLTEPNKQHDGYTTIWVNNKMGKQQYG